MQTFLPYPDYAASARCLDRKRLGKQRIEVFQILWTLRGHSNAWAGHPATRMWEGYEYALGDYGLVCCEVWRSYGYLDTTGPRIATLIEDCESAAKPFWFGFDSFHASHRSNLLRKFPEHYSQFGWTESPSLPYYWPVGKTS